MAADRLPAGGGRTAWRCVDVGMVAGLCGKIWIFNTCFHGEKRCFFSNDWQRWMPVTATATHGPPPVNATQSPVTTRHSPLTAPMPRDDNLIIIPRHAETMGADPEYFPCQRDTAKIMKIREEQRAAVGSFPLSRIRTKEMTASSAAEK